MYQPFYAFIASKYTHTKRKNHFISFISMTSMIGISLGVMVLITVISVMNGFGKEIKSIILNVTPHITVASLDPIENWRSDISDINLILEDTKNVSGVAPFVEAYGLVTHNSISQPVELKGIDPNFIGEVYPIAKSIISGELSSLETGKYNILIGSDLARSLGVWVGDKVNLLIPKVKVTAAGVFPRMRSFTVSGIFESGTIYDSKSAFIYLEDASKLLSMRNTISGIEIKLFKPEKAKKIALKLQDKLPYNYVVRDWYSSHNNFFEAIKMERLVMWCILVLIILVAVFNLLSSLVMLVTDKKQDIAILRTMGATKKNIVNIFMLQGCIIGFIGTAIGLILGIILAFNITDLVDFIQNLLNIKFLSEDVYYISYVPSDIHVADLVVICVTSIFLSFLATLYPAYKASSISPAEGLRYE